MDGLSIVGLVIIGFAIAQNKWEWMSLRNGHPTIGKVIDFQSDIDSFDGGTQHNREYPIVEYLDVDGKMKSDQINTYNRLGKFKLGDEIELVKYEGKLHHRKINHLRNIAIGAIGVVVIVLDNL